MACAESLEYRTLLSVIQVNSAADNTIAGDGLVTLREAIIAANTNTATDLGDTGSGADTIVFSGGDFADGNTPALIRILSSLPAITEDLTIQGLGAPLLTIDAGGVAGVRIFDVAGGVSATFYGLTLTRGHADNVTGKGSTGGAIRNLGGTVGIVDSVLSNNRANGSGGAIDNTGTLFISGSTLHHNTGASEADWPIEAPEQPRSSTAHSPETSPRKGEVFIRLPAACFALSTRRSRKTLRALATAGESILNKATPWCSITLSWRIIENLRNKVMSLESAAGPWPPRVPLI